MINNSITFIGLSTHKDFFEVAYIEGSRDAKPEDEAVRDLSRFDHPRKLMSYLGLVPSEHSSDGKRRQGSC